MNTTLSQKLDSLPSAPGVYFHKSADGEIIYVGKAAVLKNRVRQYFQSSRSFDNKTMALVAEIADVDWQVTDSEIDALFLESEMVKRYKPRYNILLRDDKSQMFVKIDLTADWPIVEFTRNPLDDRAEYIGPFYNGYALKKALRYLRKAFPYLTKYPGAKLSRLSEDIGLSPKISDGPANYKANLRRLISYIKGDRLQLVHQLEKDMKLSAKEQRFEEASIYRNQLQSLRELQRRVMFSDQEFLDISKDEALSGLMDLLGLKKVPKRIEGFDISHMSGTNVVASMVVFINGTSSRTNYRKFKLRKQQNNDFENMHEIIQRRFSQRNLNAWGVPDLVLIDGGKGQLDAAHKACDDMGLSVPMIGLAKKFEQIVISAKREVVLDREIVREFGGTVDYSADFMVVSLPADSHIIHLLQRIRDESHRFAVSYHTVLKRTQSVENSLESIPGIGPKSRAKLLRQFGSLSAIRNAPPEKIKALIGDQRAERLLRNL